MSNLGTNPSWVAELAEILGGPDALAEAERFAGRLPYGYIERNSPHEAAFDAAQIAALEANIVGKQPKIATHEAWGAKVHGGFRGSTLGGLQRLVVIPQGEDLFGSVRLRRYGFSGIELSELVPVLESFGFVVVEVLPTLFAPKVPGENQIHLEDIGLRWAHQKEAELSIDPQSDAKRLVDALQAVDDGHFEVDLLNRLVLAAGLRWQQVAVLRAYRHYRRQISGLYNETELDDALFAFPLVSAALLEYFETKFDPRLSSRAESMANARSHVLTELNSVENFSHDQILRGYLDLIDATVRTNYYLADSQEEPSPALVLKFDGSRVPSEILSHTLLEVFVYAPDMEGVHLRAGLIARGGIRWSDRIKDFRTEILGLAQAQIKKNAIIVPTGAKGGFVVRGVTNPRPDDVARTYKTFIRSLLTVTDNLVDGKVVTPEQIVAFDGEDYYLVVAADKGTASFSDIANAISLERGFWLGDAFASGGTHGYDHKAMAITARGAWIAVRHHFKQLDMDPQNDVIRVVGVGDMSGDVFGNGMLQSGRIALVAAFNHRHIFIDPDPDLDVSFAERKRLASLGQSSWSDYDPKAVSPGGGVWSRDAKEIPLHPHTRALLGVDAESLGPPELISAILRASVDLIWFGGIGTYLKDRDESDAEIGDPTNDTVRITADKVRARVIAEGANLAVTQRARIRYSRRGGRINTDFIDNAAGVAISDREVNLKILLDLAIKENLLEPADRNLILSGVADEVADGVLRQVDQSIEAVTSALPASARELDAFEALVDSLEKSKRLDRRVESLPTTEEFATRREAGAGLVRPELAVLLAYAKSDLAEAIEKEPLVTDPTLVDLAFSYFPGPISRRFRYLISKHPLYRQLVATNLAGEILDQMGIVWANETASEFNCSVVEVAAAFWTGCKVLDGPELWTQLREPGSGVSPDTQVTLQKAIVDVIDELARIYLNHPEAVVPDLLVDRDRTLIANVTESGSLSESGFTPVKPLKDLLSGTGLKPEIASRFLSMAKVPRLVEAGEVSRGSGRSLEEVLIAFEHLERVAETDVLVSLLDGITRNGRWVSWQIRSLRDDLSRWRREACVAALTYHPQFGVRDAMEAWQTLHYRNLSQVHKLLSIAKRSPGEEITLASLALRSLRETI